MTQINCEAIEHDLALTRELLYQFKKADKYSKLTEDQKARVSLEVNALWDYRHGQIVAKIESLTLAIQSLQAQIKTAIEQGQSPNELYDEIEKLKVAIKHLESLEGEEVLLYND
jgi:hypothetical protein